MDEKIKVLKCEIVGLTYSAAKMSEPKPGIQRVLLARRARPAHIMLDVLESDMQEIPDIPEGWQDITQEYYDARRFSRAVNTIQIVLLALDMWQEREE